MRRSLRPGRCLSCDQPSGRFREGHVFGPRFHRAGGIDLRESGGRGTRCSPALLFGFFQALSFRPDVVKAVVQFDIPGQMLDALPYILTVVILAGFVGKAVPPRAGGEPYVKER